MPERGLIPVVSLKGDTLTKSLVGRFNPSKTSGLDAEIVRLHKSGLSALEISEALTLEVKDVAKKLGDWRLVDK